MFQINICIKVSSLPILISLLVIIILSVLKSIQMSVVVLALIRVCVHMKRANTSSSTRGDVTLSISTSPVRGVLIPVLVPVPVSV